MSAENTSNDNLGIEFIKKQTSIEDGNEILHSNNYVDVPDNHKDTNCSTDHITGPIQKSKKYYTDSYEENIPFLIKDILQLKIDKDTKLFTAFNTKFKTVIIYGIIYNTSPNQFILDDGTGCIKATYYYKKDLDLTIRNLRNKLNNQISFSQITKNDNEIKINSSLDRLLKQVEIQIDTKNCENFRSVFILGKPYIDEYSEIFLRIYEMTIDDNQNRDKELFFKRDLIRYYTSYYHKDLKIGDKKTL